MQALKHSLCPSCVACPEVEVTAEGATIGEPGNQVVLKREEWNVLVDLISTGRLTRL